LEVISEEIMIRALCDYYRLPENLGGPSIESRSGGRAGFFSLGPKVICYGHSECGVTSNIKEAATFDATKGVRTVGTRLQLPFDPSEVIENLRRERYLESLEVGNSRIVNHDWIRKSYYFIREGLPVFVRRHLQKRYFGDWKKRKFPAWPVDLTVDLLHEMLLLWTMEAAGVNRLPFIWFWPNRASSCLVMTHDVETVSGRDFTPTLMDLDESRGILSSFQVIPEGRYEVKDEYANEIRRRGFEFNIHDLNHDGHLYVDRELFLRRAAAINEYSRKFNAQGFRAGAMYRNQDWYEAFKFSYDMSVPNVAHLEPMRGGCCTVMPYFVGDILELPLTAAQDYSMFHILDDYSLGLWKQQIAILIENHGLISFITHPDYLIEQHARNVYCQLLDYLRETIDRNSTWAPLPGEVDRWWRARRNMKLVPRESGWNIVGPESERASVAYAVLDGGRLSYELA
jgi:hypothetical protein